MTRIAPEPLQSVNRPIGQIIPGPARGAPPSAEAPLDRNRSGFFFCFTTQSAAKQNLDSEPEAERKPKQAA
jgi:hypothetical protein